MTTCDPVDLTFLDAPPFRFTASEVIARSPAEVFAALADAESWPRWVFAITGVTWTSPPPLGLGATRRVSMRGGLVADEVFIAWEADARMAFRFHEVNKGQVKGFAEDYQVTDLGDGTCRIDWVMAMDLGGSSLVMRFGRPVFAAFIRRTLANFRRYVERQPRSGEEVA